MPVKTLFALLHFTLLSLPGLQAYALSNSEVEAALHASMEDDADYTLTMVGVKDGNILFDVSVGKGESIASLAVTTATPLRIASVTKTYVASTLLQIADEKRIGLDTTINNILPPTVLAPLQSAGYDTASISLDHLLSHTAGLRDFFSSRMFRLVSFLLRGYTWTAQAQIELAAGMGAPLWKPGQSYSYSDTGYVLVGQVIETLSGQSLAQAVRHYNRFATLNLKDTWWDEYEQAPTNSPARARQYHEGWEVTGLNPTVDLFGGGGLIASTRDMALYYDALFDARTPGGRVLRNDKLLQKLLGTERVPPGGNYKRGVIVGTRGGKKTRCHTGNLGTVVCHLPERGITIAAATTDTRAFTELLNILNTLIRKS